MSKIYIIRHGETIWNLEHRFQGFKNSDLTEKGQNQAKLAGQFLKDKSIEQIFISPLQRVQDTLEIIQEHSTELKVIQPTVDDNLKECNYGDIEGMNENHIRTSLLLQGIDRKDPEVKFNFRFKNSESYKDQLVRVLDFVFSYDLQKTKFNTLIICHMGTMKFLSTVLQSKLEQKDIYETTMWRPGNDTVIVFDTKTSKVEILQL